MTVTLNIPCCGIKSQPLQFAGAYLVYVSDRDAHQRQADNWAMGEYVESRQALLDSVQAARQRTPGYELRLDTFIPHETVKHCTWGNPRTEWTNMRDDLNAVLIRTNSNPNPFVLEQSLPSECGPEGDQGLEAEMKTRKLHFQKLS